MNEVKTTFNNKFNLNINFNNFFGSAEKPENVKLTVLGSEYIILNYDVLDDYYSSFRPFIRSIFAITIISINLRNFYKLIGQGGGDSDN